MLHELDVHRSELEIQHEIQNEELRETRRELEEALARYAELFEFAPIGYARITHQGLVRAMNRTGARILQQDEVPLEGTSFATFVVPRDWSKLDELLRVAAPNDEVRAEVRLAGKDERYIHISVLRLAHEIPLEPNFLVAFREITDRRAREEKLARAEQALRDAAQRKDDFLAALSHELRNPLGPIRNGVFILTNAKAGSDQARRAQTIIERQVTHLTRLIEDLLDVTRITRGKVVLQRELIDLDELVRLTLDDHRASFEASKLRLASRIEPGGYVVNADPARIVQVLSNLLGNAEKFTRPGGTIAVTLRRERDRAVLRIRDTGMGIAPEVMRDLFEPFAQGPQALDRPRGGLGLGLAMARGLIELHGGTVDIESPGPGKGTELIVSLPLERLPEMGDDAVEAPPSRRRRVLIIEDHADSAESLQFALSLDGHDVEVAPDGITGLEVAQQFRPDVVLCDLGLPDMDGFAVARAFRSDPVLARTYLTALSGYAQPEDVRRASEAGFDRHVAKPPDLAKLRALVTEEQLLEPDDPRISTTV